MLRSLLAIILAVIIGLAIAKMIETTGLFIYLMPDGANAQDTDSMMYFWRFIPVGYKLFLAFGWTVGAFAAAIIALLFGRRWAPLGFLGAAAIGLQASMTLFYYPAEIWLWLISVAGILGAAMLAVRLLRARMHYPARQVETIFSGQ